MSKFPISLPVYEPEVFDNTIAQAHATCPRKGLYEYGLRRAPIGTNYAFSWGTAYHKYREVLSKLLMTYEGKDVPDEAHSLAMKTALEKWEQPELGHKRDWMTTLRLIKTLEAARARVAHERKTGLLRVVRTEDAFDLELPASHERWGGRIDEVIEQAGQLWIRDFKTSSMMGKTYDDTFDPNGQMTGYTWAGEQLSGQRIQGVLVEVIYNTSKQGPDFHQFLSARSPGQIEQWYEGTKVEIATIRGYYEQLPEKGYVAFPQRTGACGNYGGCYYRNACRQGSARMTEAWLNSNTEYREWDYTNPDGD